MPIGNNATAHYRRSKMKVKVEYTIDLSERDLAALAHKFGERLKRDEIKEYLEAQGTESLQEIVQEQYWLGG
jgi:uncharacterized protein YehS (DUF1456 family)